MVKVNKTYRSHNGTESFYLSHLQVGLAYEDLLNNWCSYLLKKGRRQSLNEKSGLYF